MATAPPPRLTGDDASHAKLLLDYVTRLFNGMKTLPLVPIGGGIDWYHPTSVPVNFLEQLGQAVSRTTYPVLYAALGGAASIWGQGDGLTTFNLPNQSGVASIGAGARAGLTARAVTGKVIGEETHTLAQGEMVGSGAGTGVGTAATTTAPAGHNNMQPSLVVRKMIRAL